MDLAPALTLGVFGAVGMGIGTIIGAGIFVFVRVRSGQAGSSVIFSFVIAEMTALMTVRSAIRFFVDEVFAPY